MGLIYIDIFNTSPSLHILFHDNITLTSIMTYLCWLHSFPFHGPLTFAVFELRTMQVSLYLKNILSSVRHSNIKFIQSRHMRVVVLTKVWWIAGIRNQHLWMELQKTDRFCFQLDELTEKGMWVTLSINDHCPYYSSCSRLKNTAIAKPLI